MSAIFYFTFNQPTSTAYGRCLMDNLNEKTTERNTLKLCIKSSNDNTSILSCRQQEQQTIKIPNDGFLSVNYTEKIFAKIDILRFHFQRLFFLEIHISSRGKEAMLLELLSLRAFCAFQVETFCYKFGCYLWSNKTGNSRFR